MQADKPQFYGHLRRNVYVGGIFSSCIFHVISRIIFWVSEFSDRAAEIIITKDTVIWGNSEDPIALCFGKNVRDTCYIQALRQNKINFRVYDTTGELIDDEAANEGEQQYRVVFRFFDTVDQLVEYLDVSRCAISSPIIPAYKAQTQLLTLVREKSAHLSRIDQRRPVLLVTDGDSCVGKSCFCLAFGREFPAYIIEKDEILRRTWQTIESDPILRDSDPYPFWARWVATEIRRITRDEKYPLIIFEGIYAFDIAKILEEEHELAVDIKVRVVADEDTRRNIYRAKERQGILQASSMESHLSAHKQEGYGFDVVYDVIVDNSLSERISSDEGLSTPLYQQDANNYTADDAGLADDVLVVLKNRTPVIEAAAEVAKTWIHVTKHRTFCP